MNHTQMTGLLFIIVGLTTSFITSMGFGVEYGPLDAGQPELATIVTLLISLGFMVTGWGRFRERVDYPRVPALTLGSVGVTGIVGSLIVFRPWQYDGLAGGLRTLITGVFIAVGSGLALGGYYWFRQRETDYPLAVLAGLLALGLFYLAHQRLDFLISIPLLALLATIVVLAPILAVLSGLIPRLSGR